MASLTQEQLLEAIDGMTVLELSEFIKKFEERSKGLFSTHPPIEERIAALQARP